MKLAEVRNFFIPSLNKNKLSILFNDNGIAKKENRNILEIYKNSKPRIISLIDRSNFQPKQSLTFLPSVKRFLPQPVRKEFEKPITLKELENIDYGRGKHLKPKNISDALMFNLVFLLRKGADLYFKKNYVYRAIVLETVAAIPGMVGGMFRHLYSLRNIVDNGSTIESLLKEAENERQHLLLFTAVGKITFFDRAFIFFGQYIFFSFYTIMYMLFPRTSHRFVGYLEEEAVRSYTVFEEEILNGHIENVKIPQFAIDYWKLPSNARLLDVVRAVRADEAAHRDANHGYADARYFSMGN